MGWWLKQRDQALEGSIYKWQVHVVREGRSRGVKLSMLELSSILWRNEDATVGAVELKGVSNLTEGISIKV